MTNAYVFIRLSKSTIVETLAGIREIEGVKQAHNVLGPVDIIAFVEVADLDALGETIMAILSVDGVGGTDTRFAWPH